MRASLLPALLFGLAAAACSGDGMSGSSDSPVGPTGGSGSAAQGTGALHIMLKDSPFSDAKALFVTFSEVQAHRSGGGWITLPFAGGATSRTCDLKLLTSAQDILGTGPLEAGHYTQLRLVVASSALYFDNASAGPACAPALPIPAGLAVPVTIPSGELKLNREFDVPAGGATTILLDFDGDKSIKQTGNPKTPGGGKYMMTPVIGVVSVQ